MKDQIFIRNLKITGILGVLPAERTTPQSIVVDLILETDIRDAAASRNLADTVDYAALAKKVEALVVSAEHLLVESLAEDIAALTLSVDGVSAVTVTVGKPEALANAESVGATIYRTL